MVKALCFHCRGSGFDPWLRTKILHDYVIRSKKKKANIETSIRGFRESYISNVTDIVSLFCFSLING